MYEGASLVSTQAVRASSEAYIAGTLLSILGTAPQCPPPGIINSLYQSELSSLKKVSISFR